MDQLNKAEKETNDDQTRFHSELSSTLAKVDHKIRQEAAEISNVVSGKRPDFMKVGGS